ncbi:MAG: metallophosphoesterase [Azoarcus sp.]|jgi:predicted MPP superfamily phosphohydrolase|nr:metallophosphoesterase [Azoarcus sp.]
MSFYIVFVSLYVLVNALLIARLYFALRGPGLAWPVRVGVCLLAIALSLTFVVSRRMTGSGPALTALTFAGTFWFALVLHALLAWLLLGIFRLCNRRFRWLTIPPEQQARWRRLSCAGVAAAAVLASLAGWINTQYPVARMVELPAPAGMTPLRIVLLSDTHLGRQASPKFFARVVDVIEPLAPDIVLFAGDILEYDYDPADAEATAAVLRRLKPRLGIWGALGNHEHIDGRLEMNKALLRRIGIRMLIDEWAEIESAPGEKILLIGRDDRSVARFQKRERKSLAAIMADIPGGERIRILLDHQPFQLGDAETAGIYLQLSGHTHNGQIFPFNLLAAAIYENAHGYSARGATHYWVSSGAGTWGPRVRTTGRTEIVAIDLAPR